MGLHSPSDFARAANYLAIASLLVVGGCVHRHGPAIVVLNQNDQLLVRGDCPQNSKACNPLSPTGAEQFASQQYDEYRHSGFVTLRPEMRLKVVAPILRSGSGEASPDILGYETALYDLKPAGSGAINTRLGGIETQPVGKNNSGTLVGTNYLENLPSPSFLRLYFHLRHARKDDNIALLVSASEGKLNEDSGEFEANPDAFCAAPHGVTRCISFPKSSAVNAEIRVYVRKRLLYVPLSDSISDALIQSGIEDPKAVVKNLKIQRSWDERLVPVRFDRNSATILRLPLIAGDRISY
jgi:hypothetical protein